MAKGNRTVVKQAGKTACQTRRGSDVADCEDGVMLASVPWRDMVDYERDEAVFAILRTISSPFFCRDFLQLEEREELRTSCAVPGLQRQCSLHLSGHVGFPRREALLFVVRGIRLRSVRDLATNVICTCVVGDDVPHVRLEPLDPGAQMRAWRRWYLAQRAMRCGLLREMRESREVVRQRIARILKQSALDASTTSAAASLSAPGSLVDRELENQNEHSWFDLDCSEAAKSAYVAAFTQYHTAIKETRVDVAHITALVPTLVISWSFRYRHCMDWLRQRLFNDTSYNAAAARRTHTGRRYVSSPFIVEPDVDIWLALVEQYTTLPPRRRQAATQSHKHNPARDRRHKTESIDHGYKRAQIVLVNVDADNGAARGAYSELVRACKGWRSREVHLLSLWAGRDGLQGEFARALHIDALPHIVLTQPSRRDVQRYTLQPPRIVAVDTTPCVAVPRRSTGQVAAASPTLTVAETGDGKSPDETAAGTPALFARFTLDEGHWHHLPTAQRAALAQQVSDWLTRTGAMLSFCGEVCCRYILLNPYAKEARKGMQVTSCSKLHMRGLVSSKDVREARDLFSALGAVRNFVFEGQIVEPSAPLCTSFDAMTPRHRVLGLEKVLTCSVCQAIVHVDEVAYYRCMNCEQAKGVLCEVCAQSPQSHAEHHILLRLPPGITEPEIPLLWGPSNVVPRDRFYGAVIMNKTNVHTRIYCNRCRGMIRGTRWKCAVCYCHDYCSACLHKTLGEAMDKPHPSHGQRGSLASSSSQTDWAMSKTRLHLMAHPLLCIRHSCDGASNDFLRPAILSTDFGWLADKATPSI